eukprot:TRINITY_DN5068_c0_g1_i6.p1 TRINITY_DN5068_c0_g1~~TRINITY_DN5068_c0_g1_i6.p1  ORF type:complete len:363 (+),score=52.34 TRINITY_DN5068_c0_g1_i6:211-1299(+)
MSIQLSERIQRAISMYVIRLNNQNLMKPTKISLTTKRRDIVVTKMNDLEFKTMINRHKSLKSLSPHEDSCFQLNSGMPNGRNCKSLLTIIGIKSSLSGNSYKRRVSSKKSMKSLLAGEMTQDEKISEMIRIASHMKRKMRRSDRFLSRLSIKQGATMKHADEMLQAASKRVQEVKESIYKSAKRLMKIKTKHDTNRWSTKKPAEKESKKLMWTTDMLKDVCNSIKLKKIALKKLKQENALYEKSKKTIKLNAPKRLGQITQRVKEAMLRSTPKALSKQKETENSAIEANSLPLYIQSIRTGKSLTSRPFTNSGARSTHSIKTADTELPKPRANSRTYYLRNAESEDGERKFAGTIGFPKSEC